MYMTTCWPSQQLSRWFLAGNEHRQPICRRASVKKEPWRRFLHFSDQNNTYQLICSPRHSLLLLSYVLPFDFFIKSVCHGPCNYFLFRSLPHSHPLPSSAFSSHLQALQRAIRRPRYANRTPTPSTRQNRASERASKLPAHRHRIQAIRSFCLPSPLSPSHFAQNSFPSRPSPPSLARAHGRSPRKMASACSPFRGGGDHGPTIAAAGNCSPSSSQRHKALSRHPFSLHISTLARQSATTYCSLNLRVFDCPSEGVWQRLPRKIRPPHLTIMVSALYTFLRPLRCLYGKAYFRERFEFQAMLFIAFVLRHTL